MSFSSLVGVVLACWVVLGGGNLFSHKQGSIAHSLSLSPWTTILIKLKSAKKDTKLQTSIDPSTTNVSYITITTLLDSLCPCVESKNQNRTKCCIPIDLSFQMYVCTKVNPTIRDRHGKMAVIIIVIVKMELLVYGLVLQCK